MIENNPGILNKKNRMRINEITALVRATNALATGEETASSTPHNENGRSDYSFYEQELLRQHQTEERIPSPRAGSCLTEKMIGNARKSIGHIFIDNCEVLYNALHYNLRMTTSIELFRAELEKVKQVPESVRTYS